MRRVCRNAWVKEIPSSTKAMPSTAYAIAKSVAGSGFRSSLMPWLMETTAPAVNSPKAANIDQTYASLPYPKGCRVSRCRSDRRSAISRKTSLPVSAQECAASATMDADAVSEAATVLATAISRFATNATITVITLSPPPGSQLRTV